MYFYDTTTHHTAHDMKQHHGSYLIIWAPSKINFCFCYFGCLFATFSSYGGLSVMFFSLWAAFFTIWGPFCYFSLHDGGLFWACPLAYENFRGCPCLISITLSTRLSTRLIYHSHIINCNFQQTLHKVDINQLYNVQYMEHKPAV